jgi:hypothetical protein
MVTGIYNFLNIPQLAQTEMKKHYNLAVEFLNTIDVEPQKSQQLIGFADSLMVREV